MFIIDTKTGEKLIEGKDHNGSALVWDDVPGDVEITAMALTHPFPVNIDGKDISPKVSISGYDKYYFYNEAVATVMQYGDGSQQVEPNLQAKVIAGIDTDKGFVLEVRLDKWGNTSISTYPYEALLRKISNNQFNGASIRNGKS